MAKVHDKFVIELAEVIKGYGNDPDVDDPFRLSEFYRFYELPEIAVSANHFKTMIPLEVVEKNAQPGWTTDVNDILAYLDGVVHPLVSPENWNVYSELHDMVSALLSAQPSATDTNVPIKQPKYDEWCTDCKEYDKERNSCPRWNRVIRQTVEDMQAVQQWIPCTPETMPQESGEYLVTIRYEDGYDTDLFEYNSHWREWNDGELYGGRVIAWQPKPEPWKGGRDGNK